MGELYNEFGVLSQPIVAILDLQAAGSQKFSLVEARVSSHSDLDKSVSGHAAVGEVWHGQQLLGHGFEVLTGHFLFLCCVTMGELYTKPGVLSQPKVAILDQAVTVYGLSYWPTLMST